MRIKNSCRIFILSALIWYLSGCPSKDYRTLIEQGEFRQAAWIIQEQLKNDKALAPEQRLQLQFELERIERIRQDFQRTEKEVLDYIKQYLPDVGAKDLTGWEKSGALEMLIIDGKKWYFNNAAPNLFRLDPQLKAIKYKADSLAGRPVGKEFDLDGHCRQIINTAVKTNQRYVCPVTLKIKQSVQVQPNAVPAGKVIRCWIPYPREIPQRQVDIKLLRTEPQRYIIADNDQTLQRTIYFEKVAQKDSVTSFSVEYTYRSYGVYAPVKVARKTDAR